MKNTVKLSVIVAFITLISVTCKHDITVPDKNANNTDTCGTLVSTYSGGVAPLMTTYCTRCHNATIAPDGINLTTYAGVKAVALNGSLIGSIKQQTGYTAMPMLASKLPDCQIRQIENWVQAGAPNN